MIEEEEEEEENDLYFLKWKSQEILKYMHMRQMREKNHQTQKHGHKHESKEVKPFITSVEKIGKEFCRPFVKQKGTLMRPLIGWITIECKAWSGCCEFTYKDLKAVSLLP